MHGLLLATTIPDALTFAIAGAISVIGALGVVLSRNPVHSALMLVMTLFGIAVLFVEENAQFLAAVQVIVYAGAIVVLFLFVIMLLGVDQEEVMARDPLPGQRLTAILVGALVLAEVVLLARGHWATGAKSAVGPINTKATSDHSTNVYLLGRAIFTTYLLPFEITSALLIIAVIGAVVLSRRPRGPVIDEPDDSFVGATGVDDSGGETSAGLAAPAAPAGTPAAPAAAGPAGAAALTSAGQRALATVGAGTTNVTASGGVEGEAEGGGVEAGAASVSAPGEVSPPGAETSTPQAEDDDEGAKQ